MELVPPVPSGVTHCSRQRSYAVDMSSKSDPKRPCHFPDLHCKPLHDPRTGFYRPPLISFSFN